MASKTVNTRIQLKSDTEEHWNASVLTSESINGQGTKTTGTSFVPLLGELIVYTADAAHPFSRLKVGDGNTNVINLPFIDAGTIGGQDISLLVFSTARNFPRRGQTDKLYVAADTGRIYVFSTNGTLYTQISNFTYTWETKKIKAVKEWDAGTMTTLNFENNTLLAINGTTPSLETEEVYVTINFAQTSPEVIHPQGDD